MDVVKTLGEDTLIETGKFLFMPTPKTVTFFVYLHVVVESIVNFA